MKRRTVALLAVIAVIGVLLLVAAAINVSSSNALQVTAWATIALASVGAIGIVTSIALAYASLRSADEAKQATALWREELDAIKRQLELAEKQFASAQAGARPRLGVTITMADPSIVAGNLAYLHGTEPAENVEIWIRTQSSADAARGLYVVRYKAVLPASLVIQFRAVAATASEQDAMPFQDMLSGALAENEAVVAVRWSRIDGQVEQLLPEHQFLPKRGPITVIE